MKKILVPVDFSLNAFAAYRYANNLAFKLGAEIDLINVINAGFETGQGLGHMAVKAMEEAAMSRLKYFAVEYPHETETKIRKVPINYVVRYGIPGYTLSNYTKDNDVDLLVVGTRDKHGVFDRFLGTTSSMIISTSKCPIITVHENTEYRDLDKIVMGFDREEGLEDAIELLKSYNKVFEANIDFVHVDQKDDEKLDDVVEEIVEEMLEDESVNYSFEVKSIRGGEPSSTLIDYCLNNKADMLVLYHKKLNMLERLFNKSISIKAAHQFHLPVMILPDKD